MKKNRFELEKELEEEFDLSILNFISDGYWGRAYSYDRKTSLYLIKKDEKLIKLISWEDFERTLGNLANGK